MELFPLVGNLELISQAVDKETDRQSDRQIDRQADTL